MMICNRGATMVSLLFLGFLCVGTLILVRVVVADNSAGGGALPPSSSSSSSSPVRKKISTSGGSNFHLPLDSWDIDQPIDEGLWRTTAKTTTTEVDDTTKEESKFYLLRKVLRTAEMDSLRLFSNKNPPIHDDDDARIMKPMTYGIFAGKGASIRSLDKKDQHLILPHKLFGRGRRLSADNNDNNDNNNNNNQKLLAAQQYRVLCATLLLLRGYSDAAHEVLLGVTLDNLEEAEYAATHRGQTTWAQDHPLTDSADLLHAAIHRIVEGSEVGEGDQTGYDNAKYWLAGGPKQLDSPVSNHPIRQCLKRIAKHHTPICLAKYGVIADGSKNNNEYVIPSGGGKTRTVRIESGQWDDYAFLELCKLWKEGSLNNADDNDLIKEILLLQRAELILILRYELFSIVYHYYYREVLHE